MLFFGGVFLLLRVHVNVKGLRHLQRSIKNFEERNAMDANLKFAFILISQTFEKA